MSELRRQINTTLSRLSKAMSRSEAASIAGKASAAKRKANAGGGSGQTTDIAAATDKAKRLIAANPGKYGPKGAKGKGKAKAGAKPKDPAAAKAKAEKESQAKAEHEQRQKEHTEDRAQRATDREQKAKEHEQSRAEHAQDRAQKQQEHATDRAAKAKQQAAKEKSSSGKKSSSGDAKRQEKADKQQAQAELSDAAGALANGGQLTEAQTQRLVTEGLAQPRKFGGIELTPAGRSAAKRRPAPKPGGPISMHKALTPVSSWHGWAEITKVDSEEHIVEGIASTDAVDTQPGVWKGETYEGDVIDPEAITAALPDYMQWGALREMHQPSAVGTVVKAEVIDGKLHIRAKIVDAAAWKKVEAGVYKGFSIGGKCLHALLEKLGLRTIRRVVKMALTEISLVDRPANPDARILLFKGADMDSEQIATEVADDTELAKAADPTKAIALLQQLRNDAETGGDMDAADEYTAAIRSVAQAAGIATTAADDEDADLGDDSDLAMDDGSADDGTGDVAMAASVADLRKAHPELSDEGLIALLLKGTAQSANSITKRGMALSGANLSHAKTAHDALQKMTGGAVCAPAGQPRQMAGIQMADTLAPGDLAKALSPAFDGIAKVLEQNGVQMETLAKRLEHLESQPAPGGPAVRVVEKVLPGEVLHAPSTEATELDALRKVRDSATDDTVRKAVANEITLRELRNVYRPQT